MNKLKVNHQQLIELVKFCKDTKKGFIIILPDNITWKYVKTLKEYNKLLNNNKFIGSTAIGIHTFLNMFNRNKITEYIKIIDTE